jgi:hypothetical protein
MSDRVTTGLNCAHAQFADTNRSSPSVCFAASLSRAGGSSRNFVAPSTIDVSSGGARSAIRCSSRKQCPASGSGRNFADAGWARSKHPRTSRCRMDSQRPLVAATSEVKTPVTSTPACEPQSGRSVVNMRSQSGRTKCPETPMIPDRAFRKRGSPALPASTANAR